MKLIKLSRGKFAKVDDGDFEMLKHFSWYCWLDKKHPETRYAVHGDRVKEGGKVKVKIIKMHRLLTNAPVGKEVDHINGDGLDNRRSNLRVCTRNENMQNKRRNSKGSSRFKGVHKRHDKYGWRAMISKDKKILDLGTYKSEISAARAYDEKARELFGEFARTNFP